MTAQDRVISYVVAQREQALNQLAQVCGERDALQAALDAAHAELVLLKQQQPEG